MSTCAECERPVRSRGLCQAHYHRARRARIAAGLTTAREGETVYRLDEIEHLIAGGVWPTAAVARVGWGLGGAEAAAKRHGRDQLRSLLRTHRNETQKGRAAA